jgi:hypothetical protein
MRTYFVIVLIFFSFETQARWPKKVIEELHSFTSKAQGISHPIVATFWGGLKRYLHFPSNKGNLTYVRSENFLKKKIQVYFSKSARPNSPLIIFMPGVFGQPERGLTPLFVEYFESFRAHVLVVPNILSPMYIEAHPLYGKNPAETEVRVMEDILKSILKDIPQTTRIHVVAESLGSVVAAAWSSFDRTHSKKITDLTLLWPPLSLSVAMKNFDFYFGEFEKRECSIFSKLTLLTGKFLFTPFPDHLNLKEIKCAGEILLQDGFLKMMNLSYETYQRTSHSPERSDQELKNFEMFFRSYRAEVWNSLQENSPHLRLEFWFKNIRQDHTFPIRILTSQNDFLNFNEDWEKFKLDFNLSDEEVVILRWGGHSGAAGLSDFKTYLKMTLNL